jgi:hypothetical protein
MHANGYDHNDIARLQYIAHLPGGDTMGYNMTPRDRKEMIEANFKKGKGFKVTTILKKGQKDTPPVFQNAGYTQAMLVRTTAIDATCELESHPSQASGDAMQANPAPARPVTLTPRSKASGNATQANPAKAMPRPSKRSKTTPSDKFSKPKVDIEIIDRAEGCYVNLLDTNGEILLTEELMQGQYRAYIEAVNKERKGRGENVLKYKPEIDMKNERDVKHEIFTVFENGACHPGSEQYRRRKGLDSSMFVEVLGTTYAPGSRIWQSSSKDPDDASDRSEEN